MEKMKLVMVVRGCYRLIKESEVILESCYSH